SMMLAAFLRAKAEGLELPGDVILAIVSDEESLGGYGAKYLVENHSDLFKDVRYAIGEFGGFTIYIGNRRFYPIMVAEKQVCWIKATVCGQGGHGSMPTRGGSMLKLSHLLQQLDKHRLPVHVTPTARLMIKTMASALGGLTGLILNQLTNPMFSNAMLKLLGDGGSFFDPQLHNTVSASILHGSDKINVIPAEVSVELDGRLLPGYQPDDIIEELKRIIGNEVELEIIQHDPGPLTPDMGLFQTLSNILHEVDPEGIPVPLLLSGSTDGRLFSRIGIQTYGFLPMLLPEDFNFARTIHAADERIPMEAVDFGANAIYRLLQCFGE
ncbi:MAG: M20/M25/M40 family metallo-hydrolase, partial [Candidatus Aegiribacteria sp.]|nr:M20/M25/M40 family metallo-hydrolase [Candidatus Aegiribacteria sp.]